MEQIYLKCPLLTKMTEYSALKLMFEKHVDTVLGGPSLGDTLPSHPPRRREFLPALLLPKASSGIDHKPGLLPATGRTPLMESCA